MKEIFILGWFAFAYTSSLLAQMAADQPKSNFRPRHFTAEVQGSLCDSPFETLEDTQLDTAYLSSFAIAVFEPFKYGHEVYRSKAFGTYRGFEFRDRISKVAFEIIPLYDKLLSPKDLLYRGLESHWPNENRGPYTLSQIGLDSLMALCKETPHTFHQYLKSEKVISLVAYYSENVYLIIHANVYSNSVSEEVVNAFLQCIQFKTPEELDRLSGFDQIGRNSKQEYREFKRRNLILQCHKPHRFGSFDYWKLNLIADSSFFDSNYLMEYRTGFSFVRWHDENSNLVNRELSTKEKMLLWIDPESTDNPFRLFTKLGGDRFSALRSEIFKEFVSSDARIGGVTFLSENFLYPSCHQMRIRDVSEYSQSICPPYSKDSSAFWISGYKEGGDSTYYCAILPDRDRFNYRLYSFQTSYYINSFAGSKLKKLNLYGYIHYLDSSGQYGLSEIPYNTFDQKTLKFRLDDRILVDFKSPKNKPILFTKPKDLQAFKVLVFSKNTDGYRSAPLKGSIELPNFDGKIITWELLPVSDSKAYNLEWKEIRAMEDSLYRYPLSSYLFTLPMYTSDYDKDLRKEFVSVYVSNGKIVAYDIIEESSKGLKRIADLQNWKNYLMKDDYIIHYLELSKMGIAPAMEHGVIPAESWGFDNREGAPAMDKIAVLQKKYAKESIPYVAISEEPDSYPFLTNPTIDQKELMQQYLEYFGSKISQYSESNELPGVTVYINCLVKPDGKVEIDEKRDNYNKDVEKIAYQIISGMTFKPAIKDGQAAACEMILPLILGK